MKQDFDFHRNRAVISLIKQFQMSSVIGTKKNQPSANGLESACKEVGPEWLVLQIISSIIVEAEVVRMLKRW